MMPLFGAKMLREHAIFGRRRNVLGKCFLCPAWKCAVQRKHFHGVKMICVNVSFARHENDGQNVIFSCRVN
jgi:hypothetical protein